MLAADEKGFITEMLETTRAAAEAQQRRATWVLVGIGAGGLLVGLALGRYVLPKR
jgi:threonine dehydrogenase-like Zn-dependent dehydrogenase